MKLVLILFLCGLVSADEDEGPQVRLIGDPIVTSPEPSGLYEVAILSKNGAEVQICTGALINPKWVVTSATCASRSKNLRIKVGITKLPVPLEFKGDFIKDRKIHPGFYPKTLVNDIALLELVNSATDSDIIDILELPDAKDIFIGRTGIVSGYGNSDAKKSDAGELRQEQVTVYDNARCGRFGIPVLANKLCTLQSLACQGDQGGPLVIDGQLVGIISMDDAQAETCGVNGAPPISTYTKMGPLKAWIKTTTKLDII